MSRYKYVYVPDKEFWSKYGCGKSIMDVDDFRTELLRFFDIVNNPKNDDEEALKQNINEENWDLVFYFWTHNFESNYSCLLLVKFLDECGIDFINHLEDPTRFANKYLQDGELELKVIE